MVFVGMSDYDLMSTKNLSAVAFETGDAARICKTLKIFGCIPLHIERASIAFLGFAGGVHNRTIV